MPGWSPAPTGFAEPGAPRQARGLRPIREGIAELGGARPPRRRPATSLNRPVEPRRRLDLVTADLAAIRDLGHAHGGTVNDVVLAASPGHCESCWPRAASNSARSPSRSRSPRAGGHRRELGNQIGIMPVTVPTTATSAPGSPRLPNHPRAQGAARGASAALFVPAFLLLARTGLLRWYANHQRVVQTFVTNLRGPEDPLTFGGAAVRRSSRSRPPPGTSPSRSRRLLRRGAAHHHPVRPRPHARRPRASRCPPPRTFRPVARWALSAEHRRDPGSRSCGQQHTDAHGPVPANPTRRTPSRRTVADLRDVVVEPRCLVHDYHARRPAVVSSSTEAVRSSHRGPRPAGQPTASSWLALPPSSSLPQQAGLHRALLHRLTTIHHRKQEIQHHN